MPVETCKIDCGKLAMDKGTELVNRLAKFLKEKMSDCDVKVEGSTVILSNESGVVKRKVKFFIKKFLYKNELKEDYKIISDGSDTLIVHKIKK